MLLFGHASNLPVNADPPGDAAPFQQELEKVNRRIAKELRILVGCENMASAIQPNRRKELKDVAVIRAFASENLESLLHDLHHIHQSATLAYDAHHRLAMPMLVAPVKMTEPIDLTATLGAFLAEHYLETPEAFDMALQRMQTAREAMRLASPATGPVACLQYYHLLELVQNYFFDESGKNRHIVFTYHDTMGGGSVSQRAVGFEKACVLFNAASFVMQKAVQSHDRRTVEGLKATANEMQLAAGLFRHLLKNFVYAPSLDLSPATVTLLLAMALAQAQECIYLSEQLEGANKRPANAQELAYVSRLYAAAHFKMHQEQIKGKTPAFWAHVCRFKNLYYQAQAYMAAAIELAPQPRQVVTWRQALHLLEEAGTLSRMHLDTIYPQLGAMLTPLLAQTKKTIDGLSQLAESLYGPKPRVSKKDLLSASRPGEGELPVLYGAAQTVARAANVTLSTNKISDPFSRLGCLSVGTLVTSRCTHHLTIDSFNTLGLVLGGDQAPAFIAGTVPGSVAHSFHLPVGAIVASVNGCSMLALNKQQLQMHLAGLTGSVELTTITTRDIKNAASSQADAFTAPGHQDTSV